MIREFSGDYWFLNNRYTTKIAYGGNEFWSVEDAFDYVIQARRVSSDLELRLMAELLLIKFSNSYLQRRLMQTFPHYLRYGNYAHEHYWGVCTCMKCVFQESENYLGRILMSIRSRLISERYQTSGLAPFYYCVFPEDLRGQVSFNILSDVVKLANENVRTGIRDITSDYLLQYVMHKGYPLLFKTSSTSDVVAQYLRAYMYYALLEYNEKVPFTSSIGDMVDLISRSVIKDTVDLSKLQFEFVYEYGIRLRRKKYSYTILRKTETEDRFEYVMKIKADSYINAELEWQRRRMENDVYDYVIIPSDSFKAKKYEGLCFGTNNFI